MAEVKVTLSRNYYAQTLGEENAGKLPESVIRDAESSVERYLLNHSIEFHESINTAISKSLDENRETLRAAGIYLDGDDEDEEDEEDDPAVAGISAATAAAAAVVSADETTEADN